MQNMLGPIPKRVSKLINHIYSLSYPNLLSFLQDDVFKKNSLDSAEEFLKLAMFHQSEQLRLFSKNIGNLGQKKLHLTLDLTAYQKIVSSDANSMEYDKNIALYWKWMKEIISSKKLAAKQLDFYSSLNLNPSSFLLNHYSTQIDIYLRRQIKQTYIQAVHKWSLTGLNSSESAFYSQNYHIWRLFPPEMFSLADQPLVKGALNNGNIINHLPIGKTKHANSENLISQTLQSLREIERSMAWISRFNLYNQIEVRKVVTQAILAIKRNVSILESIKKELKFKQLARTLLIAVNSLYVICRKIIHEPQFTQKNQLCMEHSMIRPIVNSILQLFPDNYSKEQVFAKIVSEIESQFIDEQIKLNDKYKVLSDKYAPNANLRVRGKSKIFEKQIFTKLIRFHILLALFSDNSGSWLRSSRKFFRLQSIETFYRDNLAFGDLCAETIYTAMISAQKFRENQMIINRKSKLWQYLSNAQKQYNMIVPIMTSPSLMNRSYKLTRLNIFQNLMLDTNIHNMRYQSTIVSMEDKQSSIGLNNKSNIVASLLNDQEFASHHLMVGELKKSIGAFIDNKDVRVLVQSSGKYPLFCDYVLTNNNQKSRLQEKRSVWIRNQFCSKHRIVDINQWDLFCKQSKDESEAVKSKKIILYPSQLGQCFKKINNGISELSRQNYI